jgi:hypothetical protein
MENVTQSRSPAVALPPPGSPWEHDLRKSGYAALLFIQDASFPGRAILRVSSYQPTQIHTLKYCLGFYYII